MLNNLNNILEKFIGNKSSNNIENFNQIEEKFRKILLKRGKTQEFFVKMLFFFNKINKNCSIFYKKVLTFQNIDLILL